MNKTVDRYIARMVGVSTLYVLLSLIAIFAFFEFIDELKRVGKGRYGIWEVAQFVLLSTPRVTYEFFPVAALIGSLIGLGTLNGNSELTVIRMAGMSLRRIAQPVVITGLVLSLAALLLGELLLPRSEQSARIMRSVAMADQITLKTRNGYWIRDGGNFINIRKVLPGNRVEDIFIYEYGNDYQLRASTHAKTAAYRNDGWQLEGIEQSFIEAGRITNRVLERATWESMLKPDLVNLVVVEPDMLSMYTLIDYIRYLKTNGQNTLRYQQALYLKMIYPLATAVMVLLALPIVLRAVRAINIGQRVVMGALIGLSFHLINKMSSQLGVVLQMNPLLTTAAPTFITLGVVVYLMSRLR
jgi:lipopolysaccharide export system permease protein